MQIVLQTFKFYIAFLGTDIAPLLSSVRSQAKKKTADLVKTLLPLKFCIAQLHDMLLLDVQEVIQVICFGFY